MQAKEVELFFGKKRQKKYDLKEIGQIMYFQYGSIFFDLFSLEKVQYVCDLM